MITTHGLYIHVPWCRRRCPYCDFFLEIQKPNKNFADLIINEFYKQEKNFHAQPAQSLYFGGGTPSLLTSNLLEKIITFFKKNNNLEEITLEANPEDITQESAQIWRDLGINRISLGVQSFDNKILKFLGRKHNSQQAWDAINFLLQAGFNNISVDLIIGVPNENRESLKKNIILLSQKSIKHISTYLLTIEKNTFFYKQIKNKLLPDIDSDFQANSYRFIQELLINLGYLQYDISSFAQKLEFMSRHNQIYWAGGSYLGLGPGAHSMRYLPSGAIERIHNNSALSIFLEQKNNYEREVLIPKQAFLEALMIGLRNMHRGIDPTNLALRHKTKVTLALVNLLGNLVKNKYLEKNNNNYQITAYGALFSDYIMRQIIDLE